MNQQSHTSLGGKMPYEVVYNRKPPWESRIPSDQLSKVYEVENEELDIVNDILWKVPEKKQDSPTIDDSGSIDESNADQSDNNVRTAGAVSYIFHKFILYSLLIYTTRYNNLN